jgi:hypothetical protein
METKHVIINDEIVSLEFIRGFSKVTDTSESFSRPYFSFEIHYLNKVSHLIEVTSKVECPQDLNQDDKLQFLVDQLNFTKEKALKLRETLSKLATGQNELKELVSDENGNWNLK